MTTSGEQAHTGLGHVSSQHVVVEPVPDAAAFGPGKPRRFATAT
ncbi:hypothetical protein [Terrabacter sp. Soil811]|nr:hypothetical protein [Terrabacter sp. Soil811]